jgi:hypothetical protein
MDGREDGTPEHPADCTEEVTAVMARSVAHAETREVGALTKLYRWVVGR